MGDSDVSKKLSYARRRFSDADLEALPVKDAAMPYEEVDFSQNDLSVEGLRKVLELCQCCKNIRVLKLFKNNIDNDGAKELAKFLRNCETLEELHLSHNRFTIEGVEAIVSAAEEARKEDQSPLWLRLEQNDVKNPEKAIKDLMKNYSVCDRQDAKNCTVKKCKHGKKVHLPHFEFQKGCNKGGGKGNGSWGKDEWWGDHGNAWDKGKHENARDRWSDNRDARWNDHDTRRDRGGVKREYSPARRPVRMKSPEPEARPSGKKGLPIASGMFLRAMGAALRETKHKGDPEKAAAGEAGGEERTDGPPAKKQKANVASAMLSRLGVITRKKKVKLTEAKHKDEADGEAASEEYEASEEGSDVEVASQAAAKEVAVEASEAEGESGSEAAKPQKATKSDDASSAKGSPPPARQPVRRQASPPQRRGSPPRRGPSPARRGLSPRRPPPRRDSPPRRGDIRQHRRVVHDRSPPRRRGMDAPRGGDRRRDDFDRRGGRGMDGMRRGERHRRDDERRGEGRGMRGVREGRRGGGADRSRSMRRAPVRREAPRGDDRGGRHADDRRPPVRGGNRCNVRSDDDMSDSLSPSPPPRRGDPDKVARAAATARAEKLVEDLRVPLKKADKKDPEPMEAGTRGGVVAARPKGKAGPRAAQAAAAGGAAKAAGGKAGVAGGEVEYSYTEEYSYTDAEESGNEKVGAAKPVRPAKK